MYVCGHLSACVSQVSHSVYILSELLLTWWVISGLAVAGSLLFFFIIPLWWSQFSNSKFLPF